MKALHSLSFPGLIVAVAALCGLKLWLSTDIGLLGDEAFYYLESRHLAMSYSDLPPLTAWTIWLGTAVVGDSAAGIRWLFVVLGSLTPLLVYALSRQLTTVAPSVLAALFSLVLPLHLTQGLLAVPDVLLNVLWLAALWLYLRAHNRSTVHWVLLGVVLGLGLLTHYRFVVLPVVLCVHLLVDHRRRGDLRSAGPWCAALLALGALAWPWLASQQISASALQFQLLERHPWQFHVAGLSFPLRDALAVTPGIFLLLLIAVRCLSRAPRQHGAATAILWSGITPILIYWLLAPWADQERSQFHWTLAGWLTLCAGLPAALGVLRKRCGPLLRRSLLTVTVLLGVVPGIALPLYIRWLGDNPGVAVGTTALLPANLLGWSQIAQLVNDRRAGRPVLADNFMLAAQLSLYLGESVPSLNHPLNTRHGRAGQLGAWQLDEQAAQIAQPVASLLVVEESALPLGERPGWARRLCSLFPGLTIAEELTLYARRKRFLLYNVSADAGGCDQPSFWYLDQPTADSQIGDQVEFSGWAFEDYRGVAAVEIWKGGALLAPTRYGLARPGVAEFFAGSNDPQHPNVGFSGRVDTQGWGAGEHTVELKIIERDGSERWSEPLRLIK